MTRRNRMLTPVAVAAILGVAALGLSACGGSSDAAETSASVASAVAQPDYASLSPEEEAAVTFAKDLTAQQLPQAEAVAAIEAAGFTWRVVEIDGTPQSATMDYRPDRMNLVVNDGTVTMVTMG